MKNKWSNYSLWVGLAAILGMVLIDTGIIADLGRYNEYVKAIFAVLGMAGVISNPSIGKGFSDKENK